MEKFFEGIGDQVFGNQAFAALAPAILFWTGGFLAWAWGTGAARAWTPADVNTWLQTYESSSVVILGALVVILVSSSVAVSLLTLPVLRLIEGYWPNWPWLHRAHRNRTERLGAELDCLESRAQALGTRPVDDLEQREREELAMLDRRLRLAPADPGHRMPTIIGNILRSAEMRPLDKYGLDAVVCWPRLWLLLPSEAQQNITEARGALDAATRAAIWGVLALVWSFWAPLAAPVIAVIVIVLAYRSMRVAAEVYGDLVESAFDLYRFGLYRSVGWTLPASPAEERPAGLQLSEYLFRGTASPTMRFTFPT